MEKVIYSDVHGKKAEYLGSGVYRITSLAAWVQPTGDSAAIVIKKDNIDAIHAAIHADDEPEAEPEADCCGNCLYGRNWGKPCKSAPEQGNCLKRLPNAGDNRRIRWAVVYKYEWCGEHRRKE